MEMRPDGAEDEEGEDEDNIDLTCRETVPISK